MSKLSKEQKERLRNHPLYNKARMWANMILRDKHTRETSDESLPGFINDKVSGSE